VRSVTLKYMRRKFLCGLAALGFAPVLAAQSVPARDLWDFPLGAVLEPAAIASEAGSGLWNPASIAMPAGTFARLGVAALTPTATQGVDAQLVAASWRRKTGTTFGVSVARSSVSGIVRTDTDPNGFGNVTYSSLVASFTAARQLLPHVTGGVALRYRDGTSDVTTSSALAADLGVIVDSLPWRDARFAVSSFLWRPGRESDDQPTLLSAFDFRVLSSKTAPNIRVGYQHNATFHGIRESGPFLSAQTGPLEVRGSLVNTTVYGHSNNRVRSGLALHLARYVVGIGREEGTGGLAPLYQFTLSSLVK
jgi:hypothetical protein